jgi:hypothetical protein
LCSRGGFGEKKSFVVVSFEVMGVSLQFKDEEE